jgi:hypothetical protein
MCSLDGGDEIVVLPVDHLDCGVFGDAFDSRSDQLLPFYRCNCQRC